MLHYPASKQFLANNGLASAGTLEIAALEAPLTLFVRSKNRVLPARLTEYSVTAEAFDPNLNPLRTKVTLSLRVLNLACSFRVYLREICLREEFDPTRRRFE